MWAVAKSLESLPKDIRDCRLDIQVDNQASRSYFQETTETLISDLEVNEVQLTVHLPISPEKHAEFQKATEDDPAMQALGTVVLLFKAQKLIVPQSMRKEMIDRFHESHEGIVKCKQRAQDILFWHGM